MVIRIINQRLIREALDKLADIEYEGRGGLRRVHFIDSYLWLNRVGVKKVYSRKLGYVCMKAWQKSWKEGYLLIKKYIMEKNLPNLNVPFADIQRILLGQAVGNGEGKDTKSYLDHAYMEVLKSNNIVLDWFWANYLMEWDNALEIYRKKHRRRN